MRFESVIWRISAIKEKRPAAAVVFLIALIVASLFLATGIIQLA